jgi:hypothetical protein
MEKKYLVSVGSSYVVDIVLTESIANQCYHSGACDESVENVRLMSQIRTQFANIGTDTMRKAIVDILGEKEANKMNRAQLESWVLFEAGANFIEGDYEEIIADDSD